MAVLAAQNEDIWRTILLTIACMLTAMATLWLERFSGAPTPLWAPAGVALAGFMIGGPRLWPAVAAGLFVAPWLIGEFPAVGTQGIMTCASTVAAVMAAHAVRRMAILTDAPLSLHRRMIMTSLIIMASAWVSALIRAFGLVATGTAPVALLDDISFAWFARDGLGILVFMPIILIWWRHRAKDLTAARLLHMVLALLATSITAWIVFLEPKSGANAWNIFPLLVWSAVVGHLRGGTVAVVILAVMAMAGTTIGKGPFSANGVDMAGNILLLQKFLASASLMTLMLAAIAQDQQTTASLRKTTNELREREAQLALFVEHTPAAMAMFDREMRYLVASHRYLTEYGLPPDTLLTGRSIYDVFPNFPERWRAMHNQVLDGMEASADAQPVTRGDGHIDIVRWLAKPWLDSEGKVAGLVVFSEVVTEAVENRREIEEAEARYRSVFEQAAVGFARVEINGRFLEVNDRFCEILGRKRKELLATTFDQITHPHDRVASEEGTIRLIDSVPLLSIERRYVGKDGNDIWTNVSANMVTNSAGVPDCYLVAIEDISARKTAEAALKESEEQLRFAHEAAGVTAWQFDPAEKFSVTACIAGGFGIATPANVAIGPEDKMVALFYEDDIPTRNAAEAALATGGLFDHTVAIRTAENAQRWIRGLGRAEYAPDGRPLRLIGLAIDVTAMENAQNQLRAAHEELLRISRLSAMGAFASTLAHELNQPLTAATSYMQACELTLKSSPQDQDSELIEMVRLAAAEVLRAGDIIRKMRQFTISGEIAVQPEDLNKIINEASTAKRRRSVASGLTIKCHFDPKAQFVLVDRIQIGQVLANLLANAVEAMRECLFKHIDITTQRQGDMVLVQIKDSGSGFAPGVLEHIFEPFRTTKETGTGLGLPICRTIVEGHGGKLWAVHSPDGATLCMTLRCQSAAEPDEASESVSAAVR
ncbi:PAS domain S-box-containing protein [Sphingomonas sp. YR710]|uniref:PAS domain S-box protein n=1 Tax=Sphingomonas sp. YR710 TaxID=1882773 RepID=UPI000891D72B|nr:PAS domain S-box protein [Sphingomonas sp. YR710]SDD49581.1 PAS domain S-box-containing protein [Sphingomonas sp. YR710]